MRKFRRKSCFYRRKNNAINEIYLSCLEDKILYRKIFPKRFDNPTGEEHDALYSLKDDSSVIIKGAEKDCFFFVWDRDYLKDGSI